MTDRWILILSNVAWLAILIWTNRLNYKHGIWDGAFNHFLPIVQREMLAYDRFRAEKIFAEEKGDITSVSSMK